MIASWSDWRAEVKAAIDLRQMLEPALGKITERTGQYIKACCPFHSEKTGSFTVYADNFHCFGCQKRGDVFDWLEAPEGGRMSKHEAMQEAGRLAGFSLPSNYEEPMSVIVKQSPSSSKMDLEQLTRDASKALYSGTDAIAQTAREYLQSRGLWEIAQAQGWGVVTDEVNAAHRSKFHGRLLIPYHSNGRVVSLTARALLGQAKKYDRPSGGIPCPWNPDALAIAREQGWVILTEGEADAASALAALGEDAPVMGLPGGNLPDGWTDKLKGITCFILMDPDAAGKKHAVKLKESLSGAGVKVREVPWDNAGDVNDYLVAHGADGLAAELTRRIEESERPTDLRYVRVGFLEEMDVRANRPHPAYSTGLPSWDALLGRGFAEGLHVLGGITAGGKTALSLQIAAHNAEEGRPVIYVSYEQSKFELWARVASRLTGVPIMAFKTGKYLSALGEQPTREYLLKHKAAELAKLEAIAKNLQIVEGDAGSISSEARWTVPVIKSEAETLADAYGMPPLVVLDYLQRMPVPEKYERKELRERVALVASSLQVELARGLGCPVLVLSSVGRSAYSAGRGQDEGPESLLKSFKEAGEVEYTAYTGTVLYRLGDEDAAARGLAPGKFSTAQWTTLALQVAKNREGETGRIFARFYGSAGRIEDAGRDA